MSSVTTQMLFTAPTALASRYSGMTSTVLGTTITSRVRNRTSRRPAKRSRAMA